VREQFLKSGDLLRWLVAAVVDQNVYWRKLGSQLSKKRAICLIADEYFDPFFFETLASRIDVYSVDDGPVAEITLPHLHRSAVIDPDFQDVNGPASEPSKMPLVHFEVVMPLVD
jgi:hypothetical protein